MSAAAPLPPELAPLFQTPARFLNDLGGYRSPLRFTNGTRVQTEADWSRRRQEILGDWHRIMGPWPALLESPSAEVLSVTNRGSLRYERVRIPISQDQAGEGWLLKPPGRPGIKLPAVLVVYYEPETSIGLSSQKHRDFGLQLAERGFVTLSIGTPGGNAWKPELGVARCQPLSFHAYVAANGWRVLAGLAEVDPDRIGIVGHSYGGKWALFAAALFDRFAAVAVSDPGIVFDETRPNVNYWEPWYLGSDRDHPRPKAGVPSPDNPRTGAYKKLFESGHDLHELLALLAPRPLFVSGGSEDPPERWRALNHAVAVNKLLGKSDRVGMSNRPAHDPTPESNEQLCRFFEFFLAPP